MVPGYVGEHGVSRPEVFLVLSEIFQRCWARSPDYEIQRPSALQETQPSSEKTSGRLFGKDE